MQAFVDIIVGIPLFMKAESRLEKP
jgi:hypothetical protein